MTHFRSLAVLSAFSAHNRPIWWGQLINAGDRLCTWMGTKNKNMKNSLGAKWNASHLAVRLCALRHWKWVSMPPTTQSLSHPLTRAFHFTPSIKTARRFTAKNPWWYNDFSFYKNVSVKFCLVFAPLQCFPSFPPTIALSVGVSG